MRSSFVLGAALAALATSAAAAAAQIAPGSTFTFTGTADATDIGLGGVMLDFTKQVVASPSGNTGTFASFNTAGNVRPNKISDVRVGNGPEFIPNFVQYGAYKFTLLGLPSGRYGQDACYDTTMTMTVGATCTPYQSVQGQPQINAGVSPFYVKNLSSNPDGSVNSTAGFDLFGTVSGPGGVSSPFFGTIASTFVGLPFQAVLYTLEQQGLQGLNFTGTFTTGPQLAGRFGRSNLDVLDVLEPAATVTPEPTSVALVAAGLLGAGAAARRRRRA